MSECTLKNSPSADFEKYLGVMQSNSIRPRRMVLPQRSVSKSADSSVAPLIESKQLRDAASMSQGNIAKDSIAQPNNMKETQEDASITPFSTSGVSTQTFDERLNPFDAQIDQAKIGVSGTDNNLMSPLHLESQQIDGKKKVQFSTGSIPISQGKLFFLLNLLVLISVLWCFLGVFVCDIVPFIANVA